MRKILKLFGKVSSRTILYLLIASCLISALALRHNNQQMAKLRDAVYTADKNNGDVNTALNNLRRYIYAHMNTNLSASSNGIKPPVQLKYTYDRLKEAQIAQIQDYNQQIYTDAQNYCQSINNAYFGTTRVPCVQNYVANHGIKSTDNINIPAGLYEFDFVSPTWSPDFAGWVAVISGLLFVAYLIKLGETRFAYKK